MKLSYDFLFSFHFFFFIRDNIEIYLINDYELPVLNYLKCIEIFICVFDMDSIFLSLAGRLV